MTTFSESKFAAWLQKIVSYRRQELTDLARVSNFGENCSVEEMSLLNIPIFLCIDLWKPA